MTQKTGTKFVPTILVLGVLGAAAYFIAPTLRDALLNENAVIVSVKFSPAERSGKTPAGRTFKDIVDVQVQEGATPHPKEHLTMSPRIWTFFPGKRTKITVHANQLYGETLGCVIKRGKKSVAWDYKTGPSSVYCAYTFVPAAT